MKLMRFTLRQVAPMFVAALCLSLASAVYAQAFPAIDADVDTLVAQLESRDFSTRQQATRTLMLRKDITRESLAELYAVAKLPEVRHRLRRVAEHQTIRDSWRARIPMEGPGSIGVVLQHYPYPVPMPREDEPLGEIRKSWGDFQQLIDGRRQADPSVFATRVIRTLAGFPAHASLEVGDLIVGVNDQYVPTNSGVNAAMATDQIKRLITDHGAGTTIQLLIVRDGTWRKVPIELASFSAMSFVYPNTGVVLGPRRDGPEIPWDDIRDALFPDVPPSR